MQLMPDSRYEHLMKVAEETIGLMGIGIPGNEALRKLAADSRMTGDEIDLVAHAVNNSQQLARVQSDDPSERLEEFELIDPVAVKAEGAPATSDEMGVGGRHGVAAQPSESAKSADQPDAIEINDRVKKEAAASLDLSGIRVSRPVDSTAIAQLKTAVSDFPSETRNPFLIESEYRHALDELRLTEAAELDKVAHTIDQISESMSRMTAPKWSAVEKVASASGVEAEVIDLVFDAIDGAERGFSRTEKLARTSHTAEERLIADKLVSIDRALKIAADHRAAATVLREEYETEIRRLLPQLKTGEAFSFTANPGNLKEPLEKAPEEFLGATPEMMQTILGLKGDAPDRVSLPISFRQNLRNSEVGQAVRNLMDDPVVNKLSGGDPSQVVDAFNAALSVNPEFGSAELAGYVRQYLATGGAIPLDLQAKLRPKSQQAEGVV